MGEVRISVKIKDGQANYSVHWKNPTHIDISVAITQIEYLKIELLKKIKKNEVKWDTTPNKE